MRSLTHCSAGSLTLPITVPPFAYSRSTDHPVTPSSQPILSQPLTCTYHPHPPAPSRTSHSFFNIDNDSLLLSGQARDHVTRAIQGGLADVTLKRYSGTIRQFIRFCNKERIPQRLRFPADEFVLCAFAASSLGKHAGSTPRARLSALKAWHVTHNLEWNGSPRLRYVLNGVHNLAPGSSSLPPRPPINAKMLSELIGALNLDLPLDAAVAACAATAFWGQCRLGELLPSSPHSPPTTRLPTRAGFKRSIQNPHSCILR